jgi:hypothetical protein
LLEQGTRVSVALQKRDADSLVARKASSVLAIEHSILPEEEEDGDEGGDVESRKRKRTTTTTRDAGDRAATREAVVWCAVSCAPVVSLADLKAVVAILEITVVQSTPTSTAVDTRPLKKNNRNTGRKRRLALSCVSCGDRREVAFCDGVKLAEALKKHISGTMPPSVTLRTAELAGRTYHAVPLSDFSYAAAAAVAEWDDDGGGLDNNGGGGVDDDDDDDVDGVPLPPAHPEKAGALRPGPSSPLYTLLAEWTAELRTSSFERLMPALSQCTQHASDLAHEGGCIIITDIQCLVTLMTFVATELVLRCPDRTLDAVVTELALRFHPLYPCTVDYLPVWYAWIPDNLNNNNGSSSNASSPVPCSNGRVEWSRFRPDAATQILYELCAAEWTAWLVGTAIPLWISRLHDHLEIVISSLCRKSANNDLAEDGDGDEDDDVRQLAKGVRIICQLRDARLLTVGPDSPCTGLLDELAASLAARRRSSFGSCDSIGFYSGCTVKATLQYQQCAPLVCDNVADKMRFVMAVLAPTETLALGDSSGGGNGKRRRQGFGGGSDRVLDQSLRTRLREARMADGIALPPPVIAFHAPEDIELAPACIRRLYTESWQQRRKPPKYNGRSVYLSAMASAYMAKLGVLRPSDDKETLRVEACAESISWLMRYRSTVKDEETRKAIDDMCATLDKYATRDDAKSDPISLIRAETAVLSNVNIDRAMAAAVCHAGFEADDSEPRDFYCPFAKKQQKSNKGGKSMDIEDCDPSVYIMECHRDIEERVARSVAQRVTHLDQAHLVNIRIPTADMIKRKVARALGQHLFRTGPSRNWAVAILGSFLALPKQQGDDGAQWQSAETLSETLAKLYIKDTRAM